MAWADAYLWTSVLAAPNAATDPRLLKTFHHIHSIQHLFRQVWTSEPMVLREQTAFATATALAEWGREAHHKIATFLQHVDVAALEGEFREPWTDQFEARFPRPAVPHTLGESVVQVVLHTAHHRGQACTRMRELGYQPPTVDFIVWLWAGKPAADWLCIDDPEKAQPFEQP
jgi:uncharacterized damage-inducible protein DinB